jgi:GntR family transcriptional regulator/MocR family aminotransferase
MTADQRSTLIEAAAVADAWLVEDDFDSEYTFGKRPLPAIQGLADEGRVIYVGTFAKTLFPAMRLGFMVLPGDLAERIEPALAYTGQFPPLLLQASLADFIEDGHFFLHLNRMRRLYAERRAHFLEMFRHHLGEWLDPVDGRTGIQITSLFRSEADDRRLADIARRRGVNLAPLSLYYLGEPRRPGLLLGYAGVSKNEADRGLLVLRDVLRDNPELTGRLR